MTVLSDFCLQLLSRIGVKRMRLIGLFTTKVAWNVDSPQWNHPRLAKHTRGVIGECTDSAVPGGFRGYPHLFGFLMQTFWVGCFPKTNAILVTLNKMWRVTSHSIHHYADKWLCGHVPPEVPDVSTHAQPSQVSVCIFTGVIDLSDGSRLVLEELEEMVILQKSELGIQNELIHQWEIR